MAKKESQIDLINQSQEVILYQVDDTNICVSVILKDETFWLSQKAKGMMKTDAYSIDSIPWYSVITKPRRSKRYDYN